LESDVVIVVVSLEDTATGVRLFVEPEVLAGTEGKTSWIVSDNDCGTSFSKVVCSLSHLLIATMVVIVVVSLEDTATGVRLFVEPEVLGAVNDCVEAGKCLIVAIGKHAVCRDRRKDLVDRIGQ
jgi:hypothetical protein